MDDLLQLATRLAEHDDTPLILPIPGRVAYIVSHGQSYASNGYAIRTQGIAPALNAQGFEVLCLVRPGRPWELNEQADVTTEVTIDGVRYLHSRWPAGKVPKGERAHLEASVECFTELFRVYRPEKIIAASNYIVGLPAWIAAKRLGLPFYNEVRGFWELSREAREPGYAKTQAFRQEAERDAFVARKAGHVFTLNHAMREELARRDVNPSRISIVPNGVSQLPVIKSADDTLRKKLGIDKDSKVIGYIGSFTAYEGLDVLTKACADLVKAGEKIQLLLVGDDQPLTQAVESIKTVVSNPWLIQAGRVPHEQIADYYALLDVVVIPRKPSTVCQLVPPMKAAEALAFGKRLVVSDVAPLVEYAQKHESVVTFKAGTAASLATALQRSLKLPAPKPTTELLFARHTEPMVQVLKGEEGQKGIKSESVSAAQSQGGESQQGGDVKALLTHPEPMMLQPKDPTWFTFEVTEGQQLSISAEVEYRNIAEGQKRKAVLLLLGKDTSGNRIDKPLGKLSKSGHLKSHFMYLVPSHGKVTLQHKFTVPAGITQVSLGLCAFNHQQGDEVIVRHLGVQGCNAQATLTEPLKPVDAPVEPVDETVLITPKQLTLNGNSKKTVENVINVPVPGATLELSAAVVYRLKSAATARKAVLLFDFLDKEGSKIATIPGIGVAAVFKQHFRYLNANSKSVNAKPQEVFKLELPEEVDKVSVSVASLGITDEEQVELTIKGRCYSEESIRKRKEEKLKQQTLPKPAVHDPNEKVRTSELNVACILDELTSECLSHEVNMIKLTRENWQEQLEKTKPDFLLVESCWRGNDGNWGTLTKGSGGGKKLGGLLRYCKEQAISTVFWNKEDPPHYDKFGAVAALFDVTITTDINMVPNYKKDFGITAHALSFAAQPKIHNPALGVVRLDKAVFAGSYYSEREDRCNDFHRIVADLEAVGVGYDIYDRNHMSGVERFQYPDRYAANIIGKLPPEELWKVNNGYKYQINLNSVTDSSTMFARRVYESLASGTPVISNASKGVSKLFGDLVIMNDSKGSIADKVRELENSREKYNSLAKAGVRRVMREHTYSHRIKEICELIGIEVALDQPEITALATANSSSDVEKAKSIFWDQTYPNKKLFISLEKFTGAHVFLNQSDRQVSYAMSLGKDFYESDESFYLSDKVVRIDLSEKVSSEYLEDAVYWGGSDD